MKNLLFIVFLFITQSLFSATKNVVPRANDEGQVGTSSKKWNAVNATIVSADVISVSSLTVSGLATVSSFTVTNGSVSINGVDLLYPTEAPDTIGQVLTYKGGNAATWKLPETFIISGGIQSWYLYEKLNTDVGNGLYETMLTTPSTEAEETENVTLNSASGFVLISSHAITNVQMGFIKKIPAGEGLTAYYSKVDSPVGETYLLFKFSTAALNGTTGKYEWLAVTGTEINNTADYSLFEERGVLINDVALTTSTVVILEIFAKTNSVSNKTVSIAYQGTSRASFIRTTINSVATFLQLDDTPSSYVGQAGNGLKVNSTELALEFTDFADKSDVATGTTTLKNRLDDNDVFRTTATQKIDSWTLSQSTISQKITGHDIFISSFTTSVSMSSLTVYGTITSTSGYVGGKSTGTFGGIYTDRITFGDGSFYSSATLGGGGGSSEPSTTSIILNLYVSTVGTDTNSIFVTADQIDVMGDYYTKLATVAALNKLGAGGLDTGVEVPNAWYTYYAISNGSTISAILSLSTATFLTMPSGYTKFRPLGYVRNNASSNVTPFWKRGDTVQLRSGIEVASGADLSKTQTTLDLSSYLPPNTIDATFHINWTNGRTDSGTIFMLWSSNGLPMFDDYAVNASLAMGESALGSQFKLTYTLPLDQDRIVYYKDAGSASYFNIAAFKIGIFSYREALP